MRKNNILLEKNVLDGILSLSFLIKVFKRVEIKKKTENSSKKLTNKFNHNDEETIRMKQIYHNLKKKLMNPDAESFISAKTLNISKKLSLHSQLFQPLSPQTEEIN